MKDYLRLRTFLVLGVIAVFACAIHPLKPLDFYETFRASLKENADVKKVDSVIAQAQAAQQKRADLYPAAAVLESADLQGVELKELTVFDQAFDNSEVISMVRKRASSSIRLGLDLNGGVEFVLDLKPDYAALASGGVSYAEAQKKLKENFREYRDLAMEALRKRLESQNIFESEIAPFAATALFLTAQLLSN